MPEPAAAAAYSGQSSGADPTRVGHGSNTEHLYF